jgi:two-component system, LytTR family, sensor kinase
VCLRSLLISYLGGLKEPTAIEYIVIVFCCLLLAVIGLYFLANFSNVFKSKMKNELLRKNIVAWLIIFFLSSSLTPISGGFYYTIAKFGWWGTFAIQCIGCTFYTVIAFNTVRAVANNNKLKRLSFVQHKLLILGTLIITSLLINSAMIWVLYGSDKQFLVYLKYSIISNIYLTAAIGLVYTVVNYLDLQQKRKFDEKELELSRLRELKSKAELDALHSKVNPHFLYNALNSIADLSITDGKKARQMTVALADLFRYSINYSQNNYSTVKDEVSMTDVYLQIEKIRFEDKLNYRVQVDEETNHYLVPRFILQPLIENAVKHGLKVTGQMSEIFLQTKIDNDKLIVNISDNGPLFPENLNPGYGVKSVYDKLDLLFPGQYEIHFVNQPTKHVSIHIHKLMKNEPGI